MSASPIVEPVLSARPEALMSVQTPVKRAAELGLKVAAALSFLAPLVTRLAVGQAFFLTGRGKWQHFENTVTYFTELGIPFPEANAAFVASLELVGGICLILGLLTRLMSAGLLGTMAVALATADKERFLESLQPASEIGPLDLSPVVFLLFFLWLALFGPGAVSLDALLKRWLGLGKKASPEGGVAG